MTFPQLSQNVVTGDLSSSSIKLQSDSSCTIAIVYLLSGFLCRKSLTSFSTFCVNLSSSALRKRSPNLLSSLENQATLQIKGKTVVSHLFYIYNVLFVLCKVVIKSILNEDLQFFHSTYLAVGMLIDLNVKL